MYTLSTVEESAIQIATHLFAKNKGMMRTSDALNLGIHPRTLYQMRELELLAQVSRGLYRLASMPPLENPDLVVVAMKIPKAVVGLISALSFHDITTEIPHEVQIVLPQGTSTPNLESPPIRVFRFSGEALSSGIQTIKIDGIKVRVFGPEKTVADCFKLRNKIGKDVAIEALNLCIQRKKSTPKKLLHFARICRVEKIIMPYLEARQ